MTRSIGLRILAVGLSLVGAAQAQFVDGFDRELQIDTEGRTGWAYFTGDGQAKMTFTQENGYATLQVDATEDQRNTWWALIKRQISSSLDLELLRRAEYELRIECRLRVSHAPRRVNLHANTSSTTDFHSHLMEFDIPEANQWHVISMTTREFAVAANDEVFAQLAMMDWGRQQYRVDIDYFKVDVVHAPSAAADLGEAVPYHPPVRDVDAYGTVLKATHDAMIDLHHAEVNFNDWSVAEGDSRTRVLSVNGTQYVILRFDTAQLRGRRVLDHGLLELTTHSVQRKAALIKDFGQVRVVEILDGDPAWDQRTVTLETLRGEQVISDVLNEQMIIDLPVHDRAGEKTYFTISRPVLQRLVDGRAHGLAILPLGSIHASFYSSEEGRGARLLLNLAEPDVRRD